MSHYKAVNVGHVQVMVDAQPSSSASDMHHSLVPMALQASWAAMFLDEAVAQSAWSKITFPRYVLPERPRQHAAEVEAEAKSEVSTFEEPIKDDKADITRSATQHRASLLLQRIVQY